jgi:hypothetical protein
MKIILVPSPKLRGGPGSGNFGHKGRPGQVEGSTPNDETKDEFKSFTTYYKTPQITKPKWETIGPGEGAPPYTGFMKHATFMVDDNEFNVEILGNGKAYIVSITDYLDEDIPDNTGFTRKDGTPLMSIEYKSVAEAQKDIALAVRNRYWKDPFK